MYFYKIPFRKNILNKIDASFCTNVTLLQRKYFVKNEKTVEMMYNKIDINTIKNSAVFICQK